MAEPVALADGFPAGSRAAWEALAAKALKGRALEELTWSTCDGAEVRPLYAADDGVEPVFAPRNAAADPERPWDVRARVDHPNPARANALLLADLDGGAASGLVVIGEGGVAVGSRDDLARVLDGVLLELAPVALDAGFAGPVAAEWLGELAKGGPRAPLAFHLDPISAFAEAGRSAGPLRAHLTRAAETSARLGATYPEASLVLASGRLAHEAGGSKAQELGFAAASALAYAKALDAAGLPPAEAFPRMVLGLSVDGEYFSAIAKLRAARLIWARLTDACGTESPARIEARASRRGLSRRDAWTNLLRLTASAFAGAVGGADAVVLESFTAPLGVADAFARRQARNTQLVLMEEAALGRVDDPASGSWFLDALTRELAQAGWAVFQAIEARGGVVEALKSGWIAEQVGEVAARRRADVEAGRTPLIGVTRFTDTDGGEPAVDAARPGGGATLDARLVGADDVCPALTPIRLAEPSEAKEDS